MFSNDAASPAPIAIWQILSLATGPLLCILAMTFSVSRRRKPRLLLPAVIPLALTSVSLQLASTAMMVTSGFLKISRQPGSGTALLKSTFASASGPLLWRFVEVAACVTIAMTIAPWLWGRPRAKEARRGEPPEQDEQRSLLNPRTTIAWSTAALVAVAALVWLYHDIVEICVLLVDPCRSAEATAQFSGIGTSGLGTLAAMVSRRLATLGYSGFALTPLLAGIGFYCLNAERRTRWGFGGSMVVALAALAWCGMSISGEWKARNYLQAEVLTTDTAHAVYHTYSRSLMGYILPSRAAQTDQHSDAGFQLPAAAKSIRFADADRDDAVILTVTREGESFLGRELRSPAPAIADKVRDLLTNRLNKTVYVRADARARYGAVAQLFAQLRTADVDLVGLVTSGRNPKINLCSTAGLEILLPPPPLPAAQVAARQSQNSPFAPPVLRAPAAVPVSSGPTDPIVVQVLQGPGGVRWKINLKEVSGLSGLAAQLESLLRERQERVAFLAADETLAYSEFIDTVDAGAGAGLDKVGVVIEKIE